MNTKRKKIIKSAVALSVAVIILVFVFVGIYTPLFDKMSKKQKFLFSKNLQNEIKAIDHTLLGVKQGELSNPGRGFSIYADFRFCEENAFDKKEEIENKIKENKNKGFKVSIIEVRVLLDKTQNLEGSEDEKIGQCKKGFNQLKNLIRQITQELNCSVILEYVYEKKDEINEEKVFKIMEIIASKINDDKEKFSAEILAVVVGDAPKPLSQTKYEDAVFRTIPVNTRILRKRHVDFLRMDGGVYKNKSGSVFTIDVNKKEKGYIRGLKYKNEQSFYKKNTSRLNKVVLNYKPKNDEEVGALMKTLHMMSASYINIDESKESLEHLKKKNIKQTVLHNNEVDTYDFWFHSKKGSKKKTAYDYLDTFLGYCIVFLDAKSSIIKSEKSGNRELVKARFLNIGMAAPFAFNKISMTVNKTGNENTEYTATGANLPINKLDFANRDIIEVEHFFPDTRYGGEKIEIRLQFFSSHRFYEMKSMMAEGKKHTEHKGDINIHNINNENNIHTVAGLLIIK